MTKFEFDVLKNPMEDPFWILNDNLGCSGFTDGIIDRIDVCLENNNIRFCFDDVKDELGLDKLSLDILELFVSFGETKINSDIIFAEIKLISKLMDYYLLAKQKVERFIINNLKN